MKGAFKLLFGLFVCVNCMIVNAQTVNMHLWATGENHNNAVKTVPLLDNYIMQNNGDDLFNRYGSDCRIKAEATGFFYTKKIDGRWWLIDPDGFAGINMAVTSLPDMVDTQASWAYGILQKNGYNSTGNFLATEDMTKRLFNDKHSEKMSYTRRKNFFQNYRISRQSTYSTPDLVKKNPENYITVFDPEFESFVDNFASGFANYKNERDLLGYFSDNEINFTDDQLKKFLNVLPESDPNYMAAMAYLNSKGLDKAWVIANYDNIPDVRNEFLSLIVERYYSVISTAIKKYDPNHLYLGSRLHGKPRDSETVVTGASKYCDIVSVNYYNYVFPSDQICSPLKWGKWLQKYDKPCLITEFYAQEYNALYPTQSGAGFYTDNQSGRGIFYQSTCLDVLRSKYYVGWQYFRWLDDPAPNFSNKGIVNVNNQEYTGMTSYMQELNRQVYQLIDYMDGKQYEDNSYEVNIPVKEDTYLQLSGPGQNTIEGNEPQLSSSSAVSGAGWREMVLKFDLGSYCDSLNRLVDARIRLNYLSGDKDQSLSVCGIKNNNWTEESLTTSSPELADIMDDYGKSRIKIFSNVTTGIPIELNVRNWMLWEVDSSTVSFRISNETSSLNATYWASKQYENSLLRPLLILKFKRDERTSLVSEPETNDIKIFVRANKLIINGLNEPSNCEIYSVSGQKMSSFPVFTGDNSICLNAMAGIYIVCLKLKQTVQKIKIQIP